MYRVLTNIRRTLGSTRVSCFTPRLMRDLYLQSSVKYPPDRHCSVLFSPYAIVGALPLGVVIHARCLNSRQCHLLAFAGILLSLDLGMNYAILE